LVASLLQKNRSAFPHLLVFSKILLRAKFSARTVAIAGRFLAAWEQISRQNFVTGNFLRGNETEDRTS
jgi:hypothetical protein